METSEGISSLSSFAPGAGIAAACFFGIIIAIEVYFVFRKKLGGKKKSEKEIELKKPKDHIDLTPLHFPDVPLHVSAPGAPSRKMTMAILGILGVVILGGSGTLYFMNSGTSIFSLGQGNEGSYDEILLPTRTPTPPTTPTPTTIIEANAEPETKKVELIYYWVAGDHWNELTDAEALDLPLSQDVAIAVFTDRPHTGARFFISGRVYTTKPEDKNPMGYYYITVQRSSFKKLSDVSASLLE